MEFEKINLKSKEIANLLILEHTLQIDAISFEPNRKDRN